MVIAEGSESHDALFDRDGLEFRLSRSIPEVVVVVPKDFIAIVVDLGVCDGDGGCIGDGREGGEGVNVPGGVDSESRVGNGGGGEVERTRGVVRGDLPAFRLSSRICVCVG